MNTPPAQLDAKLAAVEQAVREAQAFEHDHGLANSDTRKLPATALRVLRRWRRETGAA